MRKASFGKPNFFERAKRTLGGCTAAAIFAWIIIHNREQDSAWHWKDTIRRKQGRVLSNKRVYPAIETGEFKGPVRTALKILTFEVIGEGKIGITYRTYPNEQVKKWEEP